MTTCRASEWTESELIGRVLDRDHAAWRELVRRYRSVMYRCILGSLARRARATPPADVDEIYAELLVNLVRDDMHKLRQWDPARGARLGSWLGLLAKNAAFDYARSRGARRASESIEGIEEPAHPDASPLDAVLAGERRATLEGTLASFPDRDRRFLALYFAGGLSPEQLAAELSMSVNTVYTRKHKLLHRLAAHMAAA